MSRLDELRFPLERDILLSQAAIWLLEGKRPIPINHLAQIGFPTAFGLVFDSDGLDALFLALTSGRVRAHGICVHQTLAVRPPLADLCPPDDQDFHIPSNWWNRIEDVNWLKSELKIDLMGCSFWMIQISTAELLTAFPSLARREEEFWRTSDPQSGTKPDEYLGEPTSAKRGKRPLKRKAIAAKMLSELKAGIRTASELRSDTQEALKAHYDGNRETVTRARRAALSEFERIKTDKTPTTDN